MTEYHVLSYTHPKKEASNLYDGVDRSILVKLSIAYLVIIIYASLLPLNVNNLTLATAWENFQQIPLLKLGVGSRADLVANLLFYIPFGFLVCGGLTGYNRHPLVILRAIVLSFFLAAIVVLGVEFTQQFFPPRTVSLNDILAEFAGFTIGFGLWLVKGPNFIALAQAVATGGATTRRAILIVYTLVYLALSLFPYDFLLSGDEWRSKLASGLSGWWFAPKCGLFCAWQLVPEIVIIIPIAMLFFAQRQHISLWWVAAAGAVFGILIELLQLTIVSGMSQGVSVISRIIGMLLGVGLLRLSANINWHMIRRNMRVLLMISVIPYLIALTWASGWFSGDWLGLSYAWMQLEKTHFLPFYYHYYSTETVAMVSLLFQIGLYLPVGVGLWLWHWAVSNNKWRNGALCSACLAVLLSCLVETGKLFVSGLHPDPTDVLIAATTAALAYGVLNLMFLVEPREPSLVISSEPTVSQQPMTTFATGPLNGLGVIGIFALCAALATAVTNPLGMMWITLPLIAYAALLWWRPEWWLVWVLALLPLLDLSPWSGRLFWTEFDTVLLVTMGVCYLRLTINSTIGPALSGVAKVLLILFTFSAMVSLFTGLLPFAPLDQNAFTSYLSSYNALRAGKGLFFALAFIPLLADQWNKPEHAVRKLALGMTLGLAGVVVYVLWERATFAGLFNFQTEYRITGPFHGMHIGGAYIETYLAAALPFVVFWAWQQRRLWTSIVALCLFGLGTYSIMVTFSRTGQAAFILATIIIVLGLLRLMLQQRARRVVSVVSILSLICISAAIAWPILSGKYSQSRWAIVEQDMTLRINHWEDTLNIFQIQDAKILGVGLGSFPSAYFWGSESPSRPSTYSFLTENDNTFLRLGSGESMYFEQSVDVLPEQPYTFSVNLRSHFEKTILTVFLCEKALLYSYTCIRALMEQAEPMVNWTRYQAEFYTHNFGPPGSKIQRPVKLSLINSKPGTTLDIDNVKLRDSAGNNLVQNGDFSAGMNHWFFSVDNYWPWHMENLFLKIFFEQGWLGLFCFVMLFIYMASRLLSRTRDNDLLSLVLCASMVAFLVAGLLNSWNDEPRLSFLFYFLLIVGLVADKKRYVASG